jgi:aerobic-type carbon monoxide dehydrogenase small subunit (CoxS/CutS family)
MTERKRSLTPDDEERRFGRRNLFLGVGVAAAATPVLESCEPAKVPPSAAGVLGPSPVTVVLRVNGADARVTVEPRATLADVLRHELGLTGTKVACDRGACSACTVWLDAAPVCACTTFALDAVGRQVTTIEGLARGDVLHPVQQAFIDQDAMQCGFCTPGMIMSCAALLARKSNPTLDDVRAATSGNLCRCGTYANVFEATLTAARANPSGHTGGSRTLEESGPKRERGSRTLEESGPKRERG